MNRFKQIVHLLRIQSVLVKQGLGHFIFQIHLLRPFRLLLFLSPSHWRRERNTSLGVAIRRSLEELGPIFVKFGQILSTRRDLLPDEVAIELAKLQDRVPPFPGELACQVIEQAFGKSIGELFKSFDSTPLASASVAQVHAAELFNGKSVVVKVIRPGIAPVIQRDLDLMYYLAHLAERYWRDGKRLRPVAVVEEFEKVIFDELDLDREAANASQLRRNFENSAMLYVPEVHWDLVHKNAMVIERIHGTPIGDLEQLKAKHIDFKKLAEHGVDIFYTQVFTHNFFHADMHPGNIFVGDDGRYIAVDFGIMGTLSESDRRYLAENFMAFFDRDYRRVAELHIECGWVPAGTRVDELESAIRTVCEPNFNRPLKEISFGKVLLRLFDTARRFNMEVQPQLVLMQKTLLNIEGLGRQLYPDLDLWQTAKPFLERWMDEQLGVRNLLKRVKRELPLLIHKAPDLPFLLYDYLKNHNEGKIRVDIKSEQLASLQESIERSQRNLRSTIIGCGIVVVSLWLLLDAPMGLSNGKYASLAGGFLAIVGAFMIFRSLKR